MTKVTFFHNRDQQYLGFTCEGHAGYSEYGSDVVCAGISILVQNTINAIERYTEEEFSGEADSNTGTIRFFLKTPAGHDAELLIQTLILGLEGIQSSYGKKFLRLQFKEV